MDSRGFHHDAFANRNEMKTSPIAVPISDHGETVVCPKPLRVGVFSSFNDPPVRSLGSQLSPRARSCGSKPGSALLDIIIPKVDDLAIEQESPEELASSPLFFSGSPPCRVSNPLTQDPRFRDGLFNPPSPPFPLPFALPPSSPSSGRTSGCIRVNFGNSPGVRIVGFDCLDRDSRSIPTLA